jgi:hypothetical protein
MNLKSSDDGEEPQQKTKNPFKILFNTQNRNPEKG